MKSNTLALVGIGIAAMLAGGPAAARKASPPLEVDLRLQLPRSFPGDATATFLAACYVRAGSLTLQLELPAAYRWIAGATQLVDPPVLSATHTLVVAFRVEAPTREAILGSAMLSEPDGIAVRRSAQISLLPDEDAATAASREAPHEERDGVARYPGRTRVR